MKFESKKFVLRVALAGALALGVASVAKADDSTMAAATPAAAVVAAPVISGLAQETGIQKFGTVAGAGNSFNAGLENIRLKGVFAVDADDTVTVNTSLAAQYANGFNLLDAYDVRKISGVWDGLSLKVGQFKVAFGQDGYASPDQLIRANYSLINAINPFNAGFGNEGNAWLVGAELDQTYSDLTLQLAAVQSKAFAFVAGTKFDYVGRAQWKTSGLTLGASDYLSSTAALLTLNTLGANASISMDVLQLDLEAIFGAGAANGYTGTLSAKTNGFQPAAWYEFTTTSTGAVTADDLGAGVNFNLSAKTRLALNVDFTGPNAGDILSVNTETVQLQEVF